MKTIRIPTLVKVDRGVKEDGTTVIVDLSFYKFCQTAFDSCEDFRGGITRVRQCIKILDVLAVAPEGQEVQLEDADYKCLKEAIDTAKFAAGVARQCIAFYDAIDPPQPVATVA